MNRLKSLFISGFTSSAAVLSVFAVWQLSMVLDSSALSLAWLGVLLSASVISAFFLRLFLMPVARTSASPRWVWYPVLMGAALCLVALGLADEASRAAALLALGLNLSICVCGWWLYVQWYSRFSDRESQALRLAAGLPLPEFVVHDVSGAEVSSQRFSAQPSLLMFYRGNWCPLCMAQIREVAAHYNELAKLGVHVAMISPQPQKQTKALAKQFEAQMHFYQDVDNQAAKALSIEANNGTPTGLEVLGYDSDTVQPTVLATGADGLLIYADLTDNYRLRPEPEVFIEVFKQALAERVS